MRLLPFEYATRNLTRSPRRIVAGVIGSALVVLLICAAAAFVRGMNRTLTLDRARGNVMLLGAGSEESIERSEITAAAPGIAAASIPGIRTRLGVPYVSPECHMALVIRPERDSPVELQASFRGVTPAAFLVHERVQIIEGRAPTPGQDELIVGALAATRLGVEAEALRIGRQVWLGTHAWTIVGRFAAPGAVMEAELWAPLADLMVATKRSTLSCVVMTLDDAEFADVDSFAKQRLDLELVAVREADYYARLMDFYGPIRTLVWVTAALVSLGGLLGGLNTMYAAFASRVREIGTLQTLGYSRLAIIVSLVQESLLISAAGALPAVLIALIALDGAAVRISMGAFGLSVDENVVLIGLLAGVGLGVIGGLPPARRCLAMPIPAALRAS